MPHVNELYDFIVTAFVVYEDTVMLVNHPRYGRWVPMGGHVELDEDPDQALQREIAEETGLEVEILSERAPIKTADGHMLYTPNCVDVHEANAPHKHISLNYYVRATHNSHVKSDEHTDIRWFTEEELEDPAYDLLPRIKFCCREALKKAKQS
ncbi:MAG TPA: NUDIX domain-containing protein [Verrucomicrobiae bacterium]|nr:NUDIX domain-containing protein [Verrucomicrobiae bacterium]